MTYLLERLVRQPIISRIVRRSASGAQTIHLSSNVIDTKEADLVVAGAVEGARVGLVERVHAQRAVLVVRVALVRKRPGHFLNFLTLFFLSF